jgi:hypothetical protein
MLLLPQMKTDELIAAMAQSKKKANATTRRDEDAKEFRWVSLHTGK